MNGRNAASVRTQSSLWLDSSRSGFEEWTEWDGINRWEWKGCGVRGGATPWTREKRQKIGESCAFGAGQCKRRLVRMKKQNVSVHETNGKEESSQTEALLLTATVLAKLPARTVDLGLVTSRSAYKLSEA